MIHHFPAIEGPPPSRARSSSSAWPATHESWAIHWSLKDFEVFELWMERTIFGAPFPKICVSAYLRDVAMSVGVRERQVVHIPLAVRHDKFRVTRPLEGRPNGWR